MRYMLHAIYIAIHFDDRCTIVHTCVLLYPYVSTMPPPPPPHTHTQVTTYESAAPRLTPTARSKDSTPKLDSVYLDLAADNYQRPHHQILIRNVSAQLDGVFPKWYVSLLCAARDQICCVLLGTPNLLCAARNQICCVLLGTRFAVCC